MKRPTKRQIEFLRMLRKGILRKESAARMRMRVNRKSFWRSVFWQGENCGKPVNDEIDRALLKHIEEEELNQLKRMSFA